MALASYARQGVEIHESLAQMTQSWSGVDPLRTVHDSKEVPKGLFLERERSISGSCIKPLFVQEMGGMCVLHGVCHYTRPVLMSDPQPTYSTCRSHVTIYL